MTSEPLTCPYCNARVPPPGPASSGGRIPCPRCGESFPYRAADTGAIAAGPPPVAAPPQDAPSEPSLLEPTPSHVAVQLGVLGGLIIVVSLALRFGVESETTHKAFPFMFILGGMCATASAWLWYFRRPRTNGATALFLVGNMLTVAVLVLPFALGTTGVRRARDPRPPESHTKAPPLGYLPTDCNLLIDLDLAELRRSEAGNKFLEQPSWQPMEQALAQVEKWTGLKKESLERVTLGLRTNPLPLLWRVTVAARTTEPYDAASFKVVLDRSKPMRHHDRLLYPLQFAGLGQGALWCVNERVLVLTLWGDGTPFDEVKKRLPLAPRQGTEGLSPVLRECLDKRLPRGTAVSVAAESVPREVLTAILPLAAHGGDAPQLLRTVKAFDAGLRFGEDVTLSGDLRCSGAWNAGALRELLEGGGLPGLGPPTVAGTAVRPRDRQVLGYTAALGSLPNEMGPMAAASTVALSASWPRVKTGAEVGPGEWVGFQVRATPAVLHQALRKGGKLPLSQ